MEPAEELYLRLIAPLERRMMGAIARIVRDPDDAADAFQEALASIWKHLARIDAHPSPAGYILRLCVNAGIDALRRRNRRDARIIPLPEEVELPAGDPPHEDRRQERRVLSAIADLPRQEATAVLLRLVEGQSFEEIAAALGCKVSTARSHLSKGRARLQAILTEKEATP